MDSNFHDKRERTDALFTDHIRNKLISIPIPFSLSDIYETEKSNEHNIYRLKRFRGDSGKWQRHRDPSAINKENERSSTTHTKLVLITWRWIYFKLYQYRKLFTLKIPWTLWFDFDMRLCSHQSSEIKAQKSRQINGVASSQEATLRSFFLPKMAVTL